MTLAWYDPTNHHVSSDKNDPLFTPLGQLWPLDVKQEWVGLTDFELGGLSVSYELRHIETSLLVKYVRRIEAKLKEKNGG